MAFFKTTRDQLKANAFVSNLEFAKARFRPASVSEAAWHVQRAFEAMEKMRRADAGYILSREGWLYAADICFKLAGSFAQAKEDRVAGLCSFMYQWTLWNEDQIAEGGVISKVRSVLSPEFEKHQRSSEPRYKEQEDVEDNAEIRIQTALDTQATTLDLSELELTRVPESLAELTRLQTLSICHTRLTSLPQNLGELTSLQELYIYGNQLASLPESICNFDLPEKDFRWIQPTDELARLTWCAG